MQKYFFCLLLISSACTSPSGPEISNIEPLEKTKSKETITFPADSVFPESSSNNMEGDKDLTEDFECARGIPEPILDSIRFPGREFYLTEEKDGIEKVTLPNGDELTITHSGCEYLLLTFEFSTERYKKDTNDLDFWAATSVQLLKDLKKYADTNFEWDKGLEALENFYSDSNQEKEIGEEIDFGGEEIRSFVSLDKVRKLNDNEYQLTVTFGEGPL